jgi:hypothetical protein
LDDQQGRAGRCYQHRYPALADQYLGGVVHVACNLPHRIEALAGLVKLCDYSELPVFVQESDDFAQWLAELHDDPDLDWPDGTYEFCGYAG